LIDTRIGREFVMSIEKKSLTGSGSPKKAVTTKPVSSKVSASKVRGGITKLSLSHSRVIAHNRTGGGTIKVGS